jgi:signal transduction histidine kinase
MRTAAALALAALAVLTVASAARAEESATTKDAELLVHHAVAFLKKEGKAKALAAFSEPKGRFAYRDLYVMAYDMSGKCLAHGAKKERIGKNFMEEKDVDGKLFMKERFRIASEQGKGWQDYKFENPATKKVEQKTVYFERVDDVLLVSGAYKRR